MASVNPELHKDLIASYDMLLGPDHMGERFKFLALYPLDVADDLKRDPPAGFIKKWKSVPERILTNDEAGAHFPAVTQRH